MNVGKNYLFHGILASKVWILQLKLMSYIWNNGELIERLSVQSLIIFCSVCVCVCALHMTADL